MHLVQRYIYLLPVLASFSFIALASKPIAKFLNRYHLPIISGYLIAGIVAGPYVLDLISIEVVERLRFVDELALGFIAFAAGAELYLKELRTRFRSIAWITIANITFIPAMGTLAMLLLADYIPFMANLDFGGRAAIAMFTGAILVARSPSSAIAIINELRAKGPFTQTVLGVTMITDVAVVILFAITSSVADTLIRGTSFGISFLGIIALEFIASILIGLALAKLVTFVLGFKMSENLKILLILALGFSVFLLSKELRNYSSQHLVFEILLEPLLICMVAGFWITNYSKYRASFSHILELGSPLVYISFFTLTGAALQLNILKDTWIIALILFFIRLFAIFISSFLGGLVAKDPMQYNRLGWATYITQAGVGLGLAKEVGVEFPEWGAAFSTMIISVIVVSQLVGPLLFKWAVVRTGESFIKGRHAEFDGNNDAVIFGLERQSNILARHLQDHGWNVQVACLKSSLPEISKELSSNDLDIIDLDAIDFSSLDRLELEHVD
ncbi:MAG TPA: cation:proton antiporter, partial [Trueperaceae bacterium]|nr:cation:proton antiporter [Trueperaceae bacterium]